MADHGSRVYSSPTMLRVSALEVRFATGRRVVLALDGVSLDVQRGESLGIVGESGCGKSTLARAILRLVPVAGGRIEFEGQDVLALRGPALRRMRPALQMVFQDPLASLNPRLTVETIVGEAACVHGVVQSRAALREAVAHWLARVGLAADDMRRYPHEFSGGQRQRIAIARALILRPRLLICDEAVSALDVSIQAQVLELLTELRAELELTCLFIAHNLAVVRHFCARVAVMYLGRIVEEASAVDLFERPRHPYTQALIAASFEPKVTPRGRILPIRGEPPDPTDPPSGCAFRTRCALAVERCALERPELVAGRPGHAVACHFAWADG